MKNTLIDDAACVLELTYDPREQSQAKDSADRCTYYGTYIVTGST
jgi:hypothetical protein